MDKIIISLGIEGTAEKTGVGIVDSQGNILSSVGKQLIPPAGGIHPREASEHHAYWIPVLVKEALEKAKIGLKDLDLVAFSQGPGLGPALRTTATAARALSLSLEIPIVGVNHCLGHVEIGRLTTGAEDPVSLYVSGGNTQVIAFAEGRYRVFGETLDIALGNCLDQFSREVGLGHPGGPKVEKLSRESSNYIQLPYTVKGMDLSFSGLLTAALRKREKGASLEDLSYSLQETAFGMLVEVTERALAHTQKKEVMLCGGVAVNQRLRDMVSQMSKEHYADFFIPPGEYCGDNGAMIAWMGQLVYEDRGGQKLKDTKVIQRYRTDQVDVPWMESSKKRLKLPQELLAKGAEANILEGEWLSQDILIKKRIPKGYRIKELDDYLRKSRSKREARLIGEAKKQGVRTPVLYNIDLQEKALYMEKISGQMVKDVLPHLEKSRRRNLCQEIGRKIGLLHSAEIIHGDLTTSNLILSDNEVVFIDFGLGRFSDLVEDKGVDLLVFKKAISGIHNKISAECFKEILKGYEIAPDYEKVLRKIEEIESRGRYW